MALRGPFQRAGRTGQLKCGELHAQHTERPTICQCTLSFPRPTPGPGPPWKTIRRQELRALTANSTKTPSVLGTARGMSRSKEPHQHVRSCNCPRSHGESLVRKISPPPPPPLKLTYFYVKKNTCLEAMPTLSVWGKWVPSLTQGQNYAWQPSPAAQQAGLDTIRSSGMGGGRGVWGE